MKQTKPNNSFSAKPSYTISLPHQNKWLRNLLLNNNFFFNSNGNPESKKHPLQQNEWLAKFDPQLRIREGDERNKFKGIITSPDTKKPSKCSLWYLLIFLATKIILNWKGLPKANPIKKKTYLHRIWSDMEHLISFK